MSVHYDREKKTLTLETSGSTYQMKADELGTLVHTWYGQKTEGEDLSVMTMRADRSFQVNPHETGAYDRTYSIGTLMQEISTFGAGDFRNTALAVRNADGSRVLRLKYVSHRILKEKYDLPGLPASYGTDKDIRTLIVKTEDEASGVTVELYYGIFEKSNVITRALKVINNGKEPVTLEDPGSLTMDFATGEKELITFCGRWANERKPVRQKLERGLYSVGSVRGASSHFYNPSCIICDPHTTEDQGNAWGFAFVYSGEFLIEAGHDSMDQIRLNIGIHPADFSWILNPGESFMSPEVIMTYSDCGLSGISRTFHHFIREHLAPQIPLQQEKPVLINNWEGTYFNFNGEKLIQIAEDASDLGLDLFVLDDGWFGKRLTDNAGLGDWYPNEEKLGMTMAELGLCIRQTGVRFGLWFEPEMINEDSDLFRAHPDWAVAVPGRDPMLSRNQLVLDLGRTEVQEYLLERMENLIREGGISYVKWDFNRSVCDKYSGALTAGRQGEMMHRFVLGTYHVLETLRRDFPDLLIEGCSGGGGRFDCGMLYYTPQIWCSDDTDPIERLSIQYGTSFIYPVSAMGSHVSASPNHQTRRRTPLKTRTAVAMSGTFGCELDTACLTDEEKETIRKDVGLYKTYAHLLTEGEYFRLTGPDHPLATVWEQVTSDGHTAIVTAVYHLVHADQPPVTVKLRGLKGFAHYRITFLEGHGTDLSTFSEEQQAVFTGKIPVRGDLLMNVGLLIPPFKEEYDSFMMKIERI